MILFFSTSVPKYSRIFKKYFTEAAPKCRENYTGCGTTLIQYMPVLIKCMKWQSAVSWNLANHVLKQNSLHG